MHRDSLLLALAAVGTAIAYFTINHVYTMQIVYERVHISRATVVWMTALLLWGKVSDKLGARLPGDKKRNGWLVYAIGVAILLIWVMG